MKKRPLATTALAALALVLGARQAAALWVETRVTPRNPTTLDRAFKVTTKNVELGKQIEVVVEPVTGKLSPFSTGYLTLAHGGTTVAHLPVEGKWEGKKLSFWFRVAPSALTGSRFELHEQNYVPIKPVNGLPGPGEKPDERYEQILGGKAFWLSLADFAEADKP